MVAGMDEHRYSPTTETATETGHEAPVTDQPPPPKRKRSGALLAILGVLIVGVAAAVFLLQSGGADDPSATPDDWDSLSYEAEGTVEETVDLEDGKGSVTVVVHSDPETCWTGYIASAAIDECGRAVYEVEGAPQALGLNVSSKSKVKAFVGLAVWDASGETKLHSLETKKIFGTLATTVDTR